MENPDILEYKQQDLFYINLYTRLFDLIELLIDHNEFNIILISNQVKDFFDNYSYYLLKKKEITKDDVKRMQEDILGLLKEFDSYYNRINQFPTEQFIIIRNKYKALNLDLNKLNESDYSYLMKEYYYFFDSVINILKDFVDVCSESGFLPNVKSKASLSSIGYKNFQEFFRRLESLKLKMAEITTSVKFDNLFKSRRCAYCILVIFSPYFRQKKVYETLTKSLNFDFIDDEDILKNIKKANQYEVNLPKDLLLKLNETILFNLKDNISLIKRYLSYELGERDMSPRIKKKYAYDPTGV